MLGICYGMQLLRARSAPSSSSSITPNTARRRWSIADRETPLFDGVAEESRVWMSHGDSVVTLPDGYRALASTARCHVAAMGNAKKKIYGVQFHPEVVHTQYGPYDSRELPRRRSPGSKRDWKMESFLERSIEEIRAQVGQRQGDLRALGRRGFGGCRDARVAGDRRAADLHLRGPRVACARARPSRSWRRFARCCISTSSRSTRASDSCRKLKGIEDPERKRIVIGHEFIDVFEARSRKIPGVKYLVQGTLYPDVIESKTPAEQSRTQDQIASQRRRLAGEDGAVADRAAARAVQGRSARARARAGPCPKRSSSDSRFRDPAWPCASSATSRRSGSAILRSADAIVREEIDGAALDPHPWQYFAVLTPVKSVGVMGDGRTYANLVAIRAITSEDGMTADWARLPHELLERISSRIVNEVRGVNRSRVRHHDKAAGHRRVGVELQCAFSSSVAARAKTRSRGGIAQSPSCDSGVRRAGKCRHGVARRELGHRGDRRQAVGAALPPRSESISSCSGRKRRSPRASATVCAMPASRCSVRTARAGGSNRARSSRSASWSATAFRPRARPSCIRSMRRTRRSTSGRARSSSKPTDWPRARASSLRPMRTRRARVLADWYAHNKVPGGGSDVLLEERLEGREVSVFALCDGRAIVPIGAACDYKRAGDGDTGPNTGGMGAYSPPAGFPDDLYDRVRERILAPLLRGLLAEGEEYVGVLYCGLMWTADGPCVDRVQRALRRSRDAGADAAHRRRLRAAARFGGARRDGSFARDALAATLRRRRAGDAESIRAATRRCRDSTPTFRSATDAAPFGARRSRVDGTVSTGGGRVLTVTALGDDLAQARTRAYASVKELAGRLGTGALTYRTDIAANLPRHPERRACPTASEHRRKG